MSFKHKHILGIEQLSKEDIQLILDTGDAFKEINSRDALVGPVEVKAIKGKTLEITKPRNS